MERLRTAPEDAATWSVFADWLSEHGDERGQLVRFEQRLQQHGLSAGERAELQRHVDRLKTAHQEEWLQGLVLPRNASISWQCGFVDSVRLFWHDDSLPFLETLRAHPSGALWRTLDLGYNAINSDGARAIAGCDRWVVQLHRQLHQLAGEGG